MAEMDWVECLVTIGGDIRNVVYKSVHDPVSVPEVAVLQRLHGENAVRDMKFVKTTETTAAEEKLRLLAKYQNNAVNEEFSGRNPNMHMKADDRPSKEIDGGMRKIQRAGTKHTAAAPFIPPSDEPVEE